MACSALKRPYGTVDGLSSPGGGGNGTGVVGVNGNNIIPPKRPRFSPLSSPQQHHQQQQQMYTSSCSSKASSSPVIASPSTMFGQLSPFSTNDHHLSSPPRGEVVRGEVANRVYEETLALRRRRKLFFDHKTVGGMDHGHGHHGHQGLQGHGFAIPHPHGSAAELSPDKPLFTFRQVNLICERMLKEKEDELTEKYQHELSQRLTEQYAQFIQFTQDQIKKNFVNAPDGSYFS